MNGSSVVTTLRRPRAPVLAVAAVVTVAYVLGAELSWQHFGANLGLAFFPPAGLTLAVLALTPRRQWPLYLACVFAAEAVIDLQHHLSLPISLSYATANTVEPLVGAALLVGAWRATRAPQPPDLRCRRGFTRFLVTACVAGPIVGALIGATAKSIDSNSNWFENVLHWWGGDGVAVLTIGAAIIVCTEPDQLLLRRHTESLALLSLAVVGSVVAFWGQIPPAIVLLPLVAWAALRFDIYGVAGMSVIFAVVANFATNAGYGTFAALDVGPQLRLGVVQAFTAVLVVTGWYFAIEVRDRRRMSAEHENAELERYRADVMLATSSIATALADAATFEDVVKIVGERVRNRLDAGVASIVLLDSATGGFRAFAYEGLPKSVGEQVASWTLDSEVPGPYSARTGEPCFFATRADVFARFPAMEAMMDAVGTNALATLRVAAAGETIGYLGVGWNDERTLSRSDRDFLEAVADAAGHALQRVRLRAASETSRAELERHAQRLGLAVDAARLLVYDIDLVSGGSVTVGSEDLLGARAPTRLTPEWWTPRIHPTDIEEHERRLRDDIRNCTASRTTYRAWHDGGYWIDVEDHRRAVAGRDGRAIRLVGAVRDITAQRAGERRTELLANISDVLAQFTDAAAPVERHELLGALAAAAVPCFADVCAFTAPDGSRIALRSTTPDVADDIVADASDALAAVESRRPRAHPDGSALSVPVMIGGGIDCAVTFRVRDTSPYRYERTDLLLAAEFARRCASVIHEFNMLDLAIAARARMEVLQQLTAALGAARSTADVRTVVGSAAPALGMARAELVDASVVAAHDATGDDAVTLPAGDAVLVVGLRAGRALDAEQHRLLATFADVCGQALARTEASELEHAVAVQLQRSMLGRADVVPVVDAGGAYRPSEAGMHVGGDWYDVIDLRDGRVLLVVGDVVGHSIDAATAMGQLRSATRALALTVDSTGELLDRLDDFARDLEGARCATIALVIVDVARAEVEYSCAGHLPPLLVAADGACYLEGARTPPIATVFTAPRTRAVVPLPPDATIVLFTDGLVERRTEDLDARLACLAARATEAAELPPDALCKQLLADMLGDGPAADDVALLVARPVTAALRRRIQADASALAPLRTSMREWLTRRGVSADGVDAILLTVGEALSNAIEHAYRGAPPGDIDVELTAEAGSIVARVQDHGAWRTVPAPGNRGRGRALMRALSDGFGVRATADGTVVRLEHRVPAAAARLTRG